MEKEPSGGWQSFQIGKNVFTVNAEFTEGKDWEFWALLSSDRHFDNPHSDHAMQKRHLDLALERNAAIIDNGDFLCLMQGKYDKRASKESVRPEHQVNNYLDAVINTTADFFKPYARNFVVIAQGNHEAAIENRLETNMTDRLVAVLNRETGSRIGNGGYSGYVLFKFKYSGKAGKYKPRSICLVLRYEHGAGGGAPVTQGVIDSYRRAVNFPDADIVLTGHTHTQFLVELARQRIDKHTGALKHDVQTHVKCPGYKDEFRDGFGGWATATKGMPPKPLGAWWIRFFYNRKTEKIFYELVQAK